MENNLLNGSKSVSSVEWESISIFDAVIDKNNMYIILLTHLLLLEVEIVF